MKMDKNNVITYFSDLTTRNQESLLRDLDRVKLGSEYSEILQLRGDALDDRRAECPYCHSAEYTKNGKDKGSRKYKCKECLRGFTEYTGTWVAGLHKKREIPGFMKSMEFNLSLVKSSEETGLHKSTVFVWRHKFLSAQENVGGEEIFKGITEVDETYYLHSQKGTECTHRPARNRGGRPTRGLSKDEAVLLTAMDRAGNIEYRFSSMGRISKADLEEHLGNRVTERTILCSDGLRSYASFCNLQNIEHHILNASKGERVKGDFHIQHINSLHSRMNSLFNHNLKGVSTKYLQKYANWQKIRDLFKDTSQWIKTVLSIAILQDDASQIFKNIEKDYFKIYKPSLITT